MKHIIDDIFAVSPDVRYVALYVGGELKLTSRDSDRAGASSEDTDRYEELLVNPALLLLARQRGNIDCGGLDYVLVRYGNFFQLVIPVDEGHASICIEPTADPLEHVDPVRRVLQQLPDVLS